MPRRFEIRGALLAAILGLSACSTPASWIYPNDPDSLYRSAEKRSDLVIAVLPFREARPVENQRVTLLMYLIPLSPYGWISFERPDYAVTFNTVLGYEFHPAEDFARAVTKSFDTSALFRRVYFTLDGEIAEADYILRGTTRRAAYVGRTWSYGLSAFGPLLWFFGLPAGTSANIVDLELELIDRNDEVVWYFRSDDHHQIKQGLYYNWGKDVLHFATVTENVLNAALRDLERRLPDL